MIPYPPGELRDAYKHAIRWGYKCGYPIGDDARAEVVLLVLQGIGQNPLHKWVWKHFSRYLAGEAKHHIRRVPYEEYAYTHYIPHGDDAQRLLVREPEPGRSLCFAVWVYGQSVEAAALRLGLPLVEAEAKLDRIRLKLWGILNDA